MVAASADPVTVTRADRVAIVTFAGPSGNAVAARIRAGLLLAVAETEADRGARAVVLRGGGGVFVDDVDLAGFERDAAAPALSTVIGAIEGATKPWVAAIEGAAVDAGLELALGCHHRIATPDARLALPQVTLGVVPGGGGVSRLCRLVVPQVAFALVAEGKAVTGTEAARFGLVDATIDAAGEGAFLSAVLAFAGEAARRELPLPLPSRRVVSAPGASFEEAASRLLARTRGQVAPAEAVAAFRDAFVLDAHDALAAERRRFLALRGGPEARALRAVARAERAVVAAVGGPLLPTGTVAVVGGGATGVGVAVAALLAGRRVVLVERDEAALARALVAIRGPVDREAARARLAGTTGLAAVAGADLVVEAVPEDLAAKAAVFAALDGATRADAILATGTSYLDVGRIAAVVADPGRVVGLHFPAPAARVVEVVRPAAAHAAVFATAVAFVRDLGKLPVESGVSSGFIGNRIVMRYRQAMDILLLEGALPWDIDAAMEGFGMAMGPYAAQDLSGLEAARDGRRRMNVHARDDWLHVPVGDRLVEQAKRFGRRVGAGWYDYPDGKGLPSPAVAAMIAEAAAEAGISRRAVPANEIRRRAIAAMVQEGALLLEEGVAVRPRDVDLVLVHGYGFPRWRGGPMHWADAEGLRVVAATIDGYAVRDPRTWYVPPLLRRLAAGNGSFASLDG